MRFINRNDGIEFRQYVDAKRDDAEFEAKVGALSIGKTTHARMTDEEFEKLVDNMTLNKEGDSVCQVRSQD